MTDAPKSPSAYRLEQAFSALQSAHARIAQGEDFDPDTGEVIDIEALAGDATVLLHATLRAAVDAADMAEAADKRAKEITARRDRYKARAETLRGAAFAAMDVLGEYRVTLPDLTATISGGTPGVVITDLDALPPVYVKTEIVRTPDKRTLAIDLKTRTIAGAELSNPMPKLTIRVR